MILAKSSLIKSSIFNSKCSPQMPSSGELFKDVRTIYTEFREAYFEADVSHTPAVRTTRGELKLQLTSLNFDTFSVKYK